MPLGTPGFLVLRVIRIQVYNGTAFQPPDAPQRDSSMLLCDLPDGVRATVTRVAGADGAADPALLRRLADLGFIAGEAVRVIRRGPGGREPVAVEVGDTLLGLRLVEARCVEVAAD